jgi:hypothetical protein
LDGIGRADPTVKAAYLHLIAITGDGDIPQASIARDLHIGDVAAGRKSNLGHADRWTPGLTVGYANAVELSKAGHPHVAVSRGDATSLDAVPESKLGDRPTSGYACHVACPGLAEQRSFLAPAAM